MKKSFTANVGAQTAEITIERALRGATETMEANAQIEIAIDLIKQSADPAYQKQIIIGLINMICANLEGHRGWKTKTQTAHAFLHRVSEEAGKEAMSKTTNAFTFPIKDKGELSKFYEINFLTRATKGLWMHLNEFEASGYSASSYLPFPLVLKHAEKLGIADIFQNTLWEQKQASSVPSI